MNIQIINEAPMPFQLPPSDTPDPREQPVEDARAKVVELRPYRLTRVVTAADVERAIDEEARLEGARAFHEVYLLVQRHGGEKVSQWVRDAIVIQFGGIADSLSEID